MQKQVLLAKVIVILVLAGYLVGCIHERVTLMVSVPDIGPQIVTKNKYTLVYGDGMHFTFSGVTQERLIAAQPHVFCSNGIPIVVKHNNVPSLSGSKGFPFFIPVLMPFILPICEKGSEWGSDDYTIDVLDCPDAHATFQKKSSVVFRTECKFWK